jgi:hypothetical protein
VYRDFNASDAIRARLMRKTYATGSNAFGSPVVMATATSASGAIDTVRTGSTTSIGQGTISNSNSFYYVLVEAVTLQPGLPGREDRHEAHLSGLHLASS